MALPKLHAGDSWSVDIILEAILLSAQEPVSLKTLREAVGGRFDTMAVQEALERLTAHWQKRGLELLHLASGYRFRTNPALQIYVERAQTARAPRYSRSVMETLAIIAYRQPVTRADIENIRGVAVNSNALKTLETRGWIESLGIKKDAPGQPTLWGTTKTFLNDLGLRKLADLPTLEEIASSLEHQAVAQEALPLEPLENDTVAPSGALPFTVDADEAPTAFPPVPADAPARDDD